MSNQPYNYISQRIISYFESEGINSGDRYNFYIEQQEDLDNQYNSLKEVGKSKTEIFDYIHPKGKEIYTSYYIKVNGIKLIIAKSSFNVTADFITTLRNLVAEQKGEFFENTAILILFSGNLDSILGGSGSLIKEGLPLHPKSFKERIESDIKNSSCEQYEKKILIKVLNKDNTIVDVNESPFDLKPLIIAIADGKIHKELYHEFGLFPHDELKTKSENIDKILESNFELFENIEYVFRNGTPEIDLDKFVSEKGKNHLIKEKWDTTDFSLIEKWNLELKQIVPPPVISKITLDVELGVQFWNRSDGDSGSKKRCQNIILFNKSNTWPITINIEFDRYIKSSSTTKTEGGGISVSLSGKTLCIILKQGQVFRFASITDSESQKKYDFKLALVNFEPEIFETIEGNYIIKKDKSILVNSNERLVFNPNKVETITRNIQINHKYVIEPEQSLCLENDEVIEEDLIPFVVEVNGSEIPFQMKQEIDPITIITGLNIWKEKRETGKSFKIQESEGKIKLIFQHKEYTVTGIYRSCLKLEQQIVKSDALSWIESSNEKLHPIQLSVKSNIQKSFVNILSFFNENTSVPSLTFIDGHLKELILEFLKLFILEIDDIVENESLTKEQKDLFWIGVIREDYSEEKIKFTPLHPINLSYQLYLNSEVGNEELYNAILKRLNSNSLVPYIKDMYGKVFAPIDNHNIPEWTFYTAYLNSKIDSPKDFVKPLISSKIKEFTENFSYLFNFSFNSPIKLNLINQGVCKEVVEGIFEYYRQFLNKRKDAIKEVLPIDVYIYGSDNLVTKFEEISFYNSSKEIQAKFDISFQTKYCDEDDLLKIFQEKVHFYRKNIPKKENSYEYAHITFHQFSRESIKDVFNLMTNVKSGISLSGLLSDVPSVKEENIYKTGFGIKNIKVNNDLLKLSIQYNSLANSANNDNAYLSDMSLFTIINMSMKVELEKLYDCSQWVTFIDPKVNLDFFKAKEDLVIVHYSDQYTNSTSFDAITVTNKSKQYQQIVEDFLIRHSVKSENKDTLKVINLFNAINGDWLLKLISAKNLFPREKISLLSGLKAALAVFYHSDIIWVPISMEEILRVSGGAGLTQEEGLFSAKNLGQFGSYSDDLLLIGFEEDDTSKQILVHFYPIELKIGNAGLQKKGELQAKKTAELLSKHLSESSFKSKFYKNFFVTQAILNAEKLMLYNIGQKENWDIISENYRTRLRNNEFEISNNLKEIIGEFGIIHFEKENTIRTYIKKDDHILFKLCEADGYKFLINEIDELKELFIFSQNSLDKESLLINLYRKNNHYVSSHKADIQIKKNEHLKLIEVPDSFSLGSKKDEKLEVLFGTNLNNNEPVNWYPTETDKVMHTNTGIIGTMGTGKTQFTKSIISQLSSSSHLNVDGKQIGILIFDYKGDYIKDDFVNATKAKVFELYHLPYNPLSLDFNDNPLPMLPIHIANNIKETISKAFGLGNVQQQKLKTLLIDAYREKGIIKEDKTTWGKPSPTLHDICSLYLEDPKSPQDSLFAALSSLYDFEIFEPKSENTVSLYSLLDGIVVVNLSGYSADIQNLVVAITLDLFYNQMQNNGHSKINGSSRQLTKMILVDEADNFLSKEFISIKKILKEGREFGVGTILSTQFLNHFSTSDNDYSNYILTWIVHRVNEIKLKEVESLFNLSTKEQKENLLNLIKKLDKHISVVNLAGSPPIMIKDKAFWELINS